LTRSPNSIAYFICYFFIIAYQLEHVLSNFAQVYNFIIYFGEYEQEREIEQKEPGASLASVEVSLTILKTWDRHYTDTTQTDTQW
jgi:hypothetical protein